MASGRTRANNSRRRNQAGSARELSASAERTQSEARSDRGASQTDQEDTRRQLEEARTRVAHLTDIISSSYLHLAGRPNSTDSLPALDKQKATFIKDLNDVSRAAQGKTGAMWHAHVLRSAPMLEKSMAAAQKVAGWAGSTAIASTSLTELSSGVAQGTLDRKELFPGSEEQLRDQFIEMGTLVGQIMHEGSVMYAKFDAVRASGCWSVLGDVESGKPSSTAAQLLKGAGIKLARPASTKNVPSKQNDSHPSGGILGKRNRDHFSYPVANPWLNAAPRAQLQAPIISSFQPHAAQQGQARCPQAPRAPVRGTGRDQCNVCGGFGHWARDCPHKNI